MSEIEVEDVTKQFGETVVLDEVSLRAADGELVVLVGPSGCGKSTLLRIIAGLEEPTAGEVSFDGTRVTDIPARKRDVSLVFQDYALFPHMTVRENLSFNLRMRGGYDDIDRRVAEVADLLDIDSLLDRDIGDLSGGQKQRVALGRAIAGEPRAFLLDEPFANLDAGLRDRMQTEIARLQRRLGITTIHVTHNQDEAMGMGDRIAVMNDGSIQQVGPPETVYQEPANLFVARFIGSPPMNLLDASVGQDGGLDIVGPSEARWPLGVELREPPPAAMVAGIRPEDVRVDPADLAGDEGIGATVTFVEYHGADQYVYLELEGQPEFVARQSSDTSVHGGQQVRVSSETDRVHVFDVETGRRLPTQSPSVGPAEPVGGDGSAQHLE